VPIPPYVHAAPVAQSESAVTDLVGIKLLDARSGEPFDLGGGPRLALLSVIRHRY
jgi:hypothetical protein